MNELSIRCGLVILALALPAPAGASASSALKRYESGKYESALREYKRLLLEKTDDPRLHFNAGAAAFQVNDFDEALKQLNSALVTQDLQLQQRAYYNLGNTEYRQGEESKAPDKKQADWQQAIGNYESALKLNPNDGDAKFNLALVKKKLEELQKQQQQQKQQQSKDDQKDQSKQDQQSKQDKDQQQKQEQNQSEQQKQQQEQKQEQKQKGQKPEDNQAQQKPESKPEPSKEENKQGEANKANGENKPENGEDQQAQAGKAVMARMTPKEAQQLLDAQKANEKAMIFIPKLRTNRADRVFKDW